MSKKIVVFGSIHQDFFSYVERFPRPGESVRGKSFHLNAGGKGANQAVAAAKLGGEVKMIGMVGDDLFADSSLENLQKAGMNVERVGRAHGKPTGCAMITVDENGENVIVVTRGANEELTVQKAREMEDDIAAARLLMCQSEVPEAANLEAFRLARKHGVKTFFNPAPGNRDMDRSILEFTDIICMNETETDLIVQNTCKSMDDFKEAAKRILELGPSMAIVTLGKEGVLVAGRSENDVKLSHVQATKTDVVDTTGAGDCFCGALAFLLVNFPDMSGLDAVKKAAEIAALSVTKRGCQPSYPTADEAKQKGIL
ncbi:Ribokinase [Aphelenchoides fujianensis]|nr:Ribokinase [Aphelenchoides fujianensis]